LKKGKNGGDVFKKKKPLGETPPWKGGLETIKKKI